MKKMVIMAVAALGAFVFIPGRTNAQVMADTEVSANIPFQFYAGDTRFPAGEYRIARTDPMNPNVLAISTSNGQITSFVMVNLANNPSTAPKATSTELAFNKYGNRYFLSSIQVIGGQNPSMLEKSRFEDLVSKGEVRGEGRRIPATEHKVKR